MYKHHPPGRVWVQEWRRKRHKMRSEQVERLTLEEVLEKYRPRRHYFEDETLPFRELYDALEASQQEVGRLRQEVEATIQRMRDWQEMEPHDLWGEPFEQLRNYVLDWADDLAAALEEQEPQDE